MWEYVLIITHICWQTNNGVILYTLLQRGWFIFYNLMQLHERGPSNYIGVSISSVYTDKIAIPSLDDNTTEPWPTIWVGSVSGHLGATQSPLWAGGPIIMAHSLCQIWQEQMHRNYQSNRANNDEIRENQIHRKDRSKETKIYYLYMYIIIRAIIKIYWWNNSLLLPISKLYWMLAIILFPKHNKGKNQLKFLIIISITDPV